MNVPQSSEHFPQVSHMVLQVLAIDDNVIKIDNNEAIEKRSKYLVHEGAKCGRCICKVKGHDKELI